MLIKDKISKSAEFQKLLERVSTPAINKTGVICTASGTTYDTQKIILELLEAKTKSALIYSTLSSKSCINFLKTVSFCKNINFKRLHKLLVKNHFKRVDNISKQGESSIRGDVVSFWPSIYEHPIRVSFWGEKIESSEIYDEIFRNKLGTLAEFALGDESCFEDEIDRQAIGISSTQLTINGHFIFLSTGPCAKSGHYAKFCVMTDFKFTYPSLFFNRLDLLEKETRMRIRNNWLIEISSRHKDQLPIHLQKYVKDGNYSSGFESKNLKIVVYTDREIFGTIFISSEKTKNKKQVNRYLTQLEGEIKVGEFIVHEDYGIAIYKGIKQRKTLGKVIDYLILEYAQKDKLSVPISQVHKLTKYIGPDHTIPQITRLGKTNWNLIREKIKKSVSILAHDLLRHYAKAEVAKGISLPPHEWDEKFASEFEFCETEDQGRAINEILMDLEKTKPANRLLVGDVGFGKTEVAIRASFRTVMNNKQVAVLCPTTILVSQHYSVFKHRMRNYPIEIAALSRFGTRKENQEIVKNLSKGKVDIIIGTHRLLSNDIKFKNLGLLIIDEEQKFGVAQKEKIKKMTYNANLISMSATPIPRTLGMALSNLRDISIITTPPPGRKSIRTTAEKFSWKKACTTISSEVRRNGQVYFLHNEVRTIESIKLKLEKLLPNVRFKVAHGQMHPATLDKIMREFYEHKFDCLICTTIIENGIDIKNVNTIIINKAQNFGLAQLYQLRGRVGRGRRQAYCYLSYSQKDLFSDSPQFKNLGLSDGKVPLAKARARLEAILESQDIGSGFKIASRDLEIRGTGNLLGKEQHGNISKVGLGLFTQMLADEVEKLKGNKN